MNGDVSGARWAGVLTAAVFAAAVVLAAEAVLHRVAQMPRRDLEVDTGVRALALGNPEILVLGSSHAGAYVPLIDRLGRERVVVVTEEGGTFSAFDWVYRERLAPLIEARTDSGRYVRDRLRRALLITTYWDTCPAERTRFDLTLPARAWKWSHYVVDVVRYGVTAENRNFAFTQMKRLFGESMLMQDRGLRQVRAELAGAGTPDSLAGRKAAWVKRRRREVVDEGTFCGTQPEHDRLEGLIDRLKARGLDVTIIAFPQMEELLTEEARRTTIAAYSNYLAELSWRKGVRIVEHTLGAPLEYDDFEVDCDHLVPSAREKYVDWALTHGLEFLRAWDQNGGSRR